MNNNIETQSANIPDILQPQPLQRAVDVTVETNILDPVSHEYNSLTGGSTRFILPSVGVLDCPNATINFEIVNGDVNNAGTDDTTMFPVWCGGLGCIRNITARCGGAVISRIEDCGMYSTLKTGHATQNHRANVLDVRHSSCNQIAVRTINNPTPPETGFVSSTTTRGFSQVINPIIDQDNTYGSQLEGLAGAGVVHTPQTCKNIKSFASRGQGPEVSIRLADIIPIFSSLQLPLFQMAQVEIEIEWNTSVGAAVTYANVANNIVVSNNPAGAAGLTGFNASFGATPFMSVDYLHYNDQERAVISQRIQQTGMAMNFTEVTQTAGINQAFGLVPAGGIAANTSTHLLGMAGKELQNIYVVKRPNVLQNPNQQVNGQVYNRNPVTAQFKSQQNLNENYNVFINNQKIYNRNVGNAALQYTYLSQCDTPWNCLPLEYDNMNYNADLNMVLGNSSVAGVPNTAAALAANVNCLTGRLLSGTKHVIGIPLLKQPSLGPVRNNGERIGTAPVQFDYTCSRTLGADDMDTDLTFFLEHRRALVITPFGVAISDQ